VQHQREQKVQGTPINENEVHLHVLLNLTILNYFQTTQEIKKNKINSIIIKKSNLVSIKKLSFNIISLD
jgi:hypothetical protein